MFHKEREGICPRHKIYRRGKHANCLYPTQTLDLRVNTVVSKQTDEYYHVNC